MLNSEIDNIAEQNRIIADGIKKYEDMAKMSEKEKVRVHS